MKCLFRWSVRPKKDLFLRLSLFFASSLTMLGPFTMAAASLSADGRALVRRQKRINQIAKFIWNLYPIGFVSHLPHVSESLKKSERPVISLKQDLGISRIHFAILGEDATLEEDLSTMINTVISNSRWRQRKDFDLYSHYEKLNRFTGC